MTVTRHLTPGKASVLRLGTRRSPLAVAQSRLVAAQVEEQARTLGYDLSIDLVEIVTEGDISRASLSSLGGVGVFVSALRDAILDGTVDFAVHSLKDLPTAPAPGLVLAAVPRREDPRDALICRDSLSLSELPPGAVIGTGSPRRACQLQAARPDLKITDIRGNVDTRLAMVTDGQLDAVTLAVSGLRRLGRESVITEIVETDLVLPAPGQGALAVECRADDAALRELLARCDDRPSRDAVLAERSLMSTLEAGCSAPLGAHAQPDPTGAGLVLRAVVGSVDGSRIMRRQTRIAPGEDPVALGRRLATELLGLGAADLIAPPEPDTGTSFESPASGVGIDTDVDTDRSPVPGAPSASETSVRPRSRAGEGDQ
jgi:hydroxymethylbilane synthase